MLPDPPPTSPPTAIKAAIKARVLAESLGGKATTPLLGGRYRLLREIGRGAVGTVWEAELQPIGKRVAVKLLRSSRARTRDAGRRLLREALAVSQIGHDHIVRIDDIGGDNDGDDYLVMELLNGRSLEAELRSSGPMPWADVATISLQVCGALAAAHATGVVHRDLKPANIFLQDREDERLYCKLLDFGLCKLTVDDAALTQAGALLGTPGYMAPEQIRGESVDARSDLYALGSLMVELLTGRPTFEGLRAHDILVEQLAGERGDLADARLELPEHAVAAIDTALALDPADRHTDASAMADAIRGRTLALTGPTRRRPRLWALGLGSVVGLAATAVAFVSSRSDSSPLVATSGIVAVAEPWPATPLVEPAPPEEGKVAEATARPKPRRRNRRKGSAAPAAAPRKLVDGIRDPFASH